MRLPLLALLLLFAASARAQITVTVDTSTTFQAWKAWRGTITGAKKEPAPACTEPSATVLDQAFDSLVNDLGINGFRYEQHQSQQLETTNDNADPFVINQAAFDTGLNNPIFPAQCGNVPLTDIVPKVVTPLRNKVLARGDPFELYVAFIYDSFLDMPNHWESNTEEAVEAFQATSNWWNTNAGYRPDFMTWNEPNTDYFGAGAWMGNFCAQFKTRMDGAGLAVRLEQPSVVNPNESTWRWDNMIAVAGCSAAVSRLIYHAYDYNTTLWPTASAITDRNNLRTRANNIGIKTGMGEICCRDFISGAGPAGSYNQGIDWVRNAMLEIVEADAQSWEPLALDAGRCTDNTCGVSSTASADFIAYKNDATDFFLNPHYWVFRQLSRYIRPGYVRVGATLSGTTTTADRGPNVKAVVFKRPNGTVVASVLNDDAVSRTITVTGIPTGTYDLHKLDSSMCSTSGASRDRCTPQVQVVSATPDVVMAIPANSVWSLSQQQQTTSVRISWSAPGDCTAASVDHGPTASYGSTAVATRSGGGFLVDIQATSNSTLHYRTNTCGNSSGDTTMTVGAPANCTQAWTGKLDLYGGAEMKCPFGHATGFFHVEKINHNNRNQWWIIDPLGNPFFLMGVQNAGIGALSGTTLTNKYGGDANAWRASRNQRLLDWGFNALSEYISVDGLPVGAFGGTSGISPQMPFFVLANTALDAFNSPTHQACGIPEAIKDAIQEVPTSTYNDFRGPLIDAYDPKWEICSLNQARYWDNNYTSGLTVHSKNEYCRMNGGNCASPWIIGVTLDDADKLYGFKSKGTAPVVAYPHPAYMIATTKFNYAGTGCTDCKLYSKYAWIEFLKRKYNNIASLNSTWGTSNFYTSFDDIQTAHSGQVVFAVGSRPIKANTGAERSGSASGLTSCSGTCTHVYVTTTIAHPLANGQSITISGVGDSGFNGSFTVAQVIDSTHFTYAQSTAYAISGSGTVNFTETSTSFAFQLKNPAAQRNTVSIAAPGVCTATDDGNGALTGACVSSGTLNYDSGQLSITYNSAPSSGNITASYTGNGYGVSAGVIDEDGSHSWFGAPNVNRALVEPATSGVAAGVKTDLDEFLREFVGHYRRTHRRAYQRIDGIHINFGPDALNNYGSRARDAVMQGLVDGGMDILASNYDPGCTSAIAGCPHASSGMTDNNGVYDLIGKPAYIWYSVNGHADSAVSSQTPGYASPDQGTQAARATRYQADIDAFLAAQGASGDKYVIGINWWELFDNASEGTNWGFLTVKDNRYDAVEARTATGPCSAPIANYSCGGETANYGDFISSVRAKNLAIYQTLLGPPVP